MYSSRAHTSKKESESSVFESLLVLVKLVKFSELIQTSRSSEHPIAFW